MGKEAGDRRKLLRMDASDGAMIAKLLAKHAIATESSERTEFLFSLFLLYRTSKFSDV